MNKYIEKSDGMWNRPHIISPTLNIDIGGYAPKYRGGCIAIIPHNGLYIFLSEDDDHYYEKNILNSEQMDTYISILDSLAQNVEISTDYVKCISKTKYTKTKKHFFQTNFSRGNFKVDIEDRGKDTSPLVTIKNDKINLLCQFSIFWAAEKRDVMLKAMNPRLKKIKKMLGDE